MFLTQAGSPRFVLENDDIQANRKLAVSLRAGFCAVVLAWLGLWHPPAPVFTPQALPDVLAA
jgi:hypothetical protein